MDIKANFYFFTLARERRADVSRSRKIDEAWTPARAIEFRDFSRCARSPSFRTPLEPVGRTIVHRGLTPDSVRVRADGQPLFSGWRWARLRKILTIAEHAPSFESSYTAPEVRQNGLAFADARSDVYSLSKVLLNLFRDTHDTNIRSALEMGISDEASGRATATEIAEMLEVIAEPLTLPAPRSAPQRWDEGHVIEWQHGRYRIVSQLGEGGAGRTFKLEQLNGKSEEPIGTFVGKVVLNSEMGPENTALNAYRDKIRSDC